MAQLNIANEPMYWISRVFFAFTKVFTSVLSSSRTTRTRPPRTQYFREVEAWQQTLSIEGGATASTTTVIPARTAVDDPMFWIGRKGGTSWLRAI